MIELVKKLRDETGNSIAECKKALEEVSRDYEKAKQWLKENSSVRAGKKADRETAEGVIASYVHGNNKIGSMVELLCETDFVARNPEFKELAQELAMQIAAIRPEDNEKVSVDWLLAQEYVKDQSTTVDKMIKEKISKLGENIKIRNVARFEI